MIEGRRRRHKTRWEHLLAISWLGVGALVLVLTGDRSDGVTLLLIMAGYAFGATANGVSNNHGTSVSKRVGALIASLRSRWKGSTDNGSSPSLLTIADEYLEQPTDNADEFAEQ